MELDFVDFGGIFGEFRDRIEILSTPTFCQRYAVLSFGKLELPASQLFDPWDGWYVQSLKWLFGMLIHFVDIDALTVVDSLYLLGLYVSDTLHVMVFCQWKTNVDKVIGDWYFFVLHFFTSVPPCIVRNELVETY